MAEVTAYIHIGPASRGRFAGRAPVPTHVLYLLEGSRPVLQLVPTDPAEVGQTVSWIPRGPDTILSDALVMLAAIVVGDLETNQALGRVNTLRIDDGPYELPEAAGLAVSAACAGLAAASVVVAVCAGSSLTHQLQVLVDIDGEVEVLTTSYLAYGSGEQRFANGDLGAGDA